MKIPAIKGCYTLIIELHTQVGIVVGKNRNYSFKAGYYAYVGSALNGLDRRIGRHLRREKKLHWHIDYLLQYAGIHGVIYAETDTKLECRVAEELLEILENVPGFGCGDCRCLTHLFYHDNLDMLRQGVLSGFGTTGLVPVEIVC